MSADLVNGPLGNGALPRAIADLVEQRTGRRAEVRSQAPVSGGCIHDARLLTLDDGRRVFLKIASSGGSAASSDIFEREAEGLRALAATGTIRIPEVLGTDREVEVPPGTPAFLLLEAIDSGPGGSQRPGDFSETFGRRLADLHRATPPAPSDGPAEGTFGFDHDNYIGATPQPNGWLPDWVDFWRRRRLGHLLELARQRGLSDPELDRALDRVMDRLEEIIGPAVGPPSLLHGDLWGGNTMVDAEGRPVLIDPATYVGHREADLAMTRLFGGFDASFYRAYDEAWPPEPGSESRLRLYELYHLLNHLLLFGRSYRGGCLSRARQL